MFFFIKCERPPLAPSAIQGVEVACFFIVVVLHLFVFLWGFVPLNVISCRSALRE